MPATAALGSGDPVTSTRPWAVWRGAPWAFMLLGAPLCLKAAPATEDTQKLNQVADLISGKAPLPEPKPGHAGVWLGTSHRLRAPQQLGPRTAPTSQARSKLCRCR